MKKLLALTLSAGLATAGAQTYSSTGMNGVELGLTGGYAGGLSGEVFVHAPNVAGPIGVKAGVSFTRPSDAINDNAPIDPTGTLFPPTFTYGQAKQQGLVTESGSRVVASLDGTYSLGEVSPGLGTTLYAGGRYGLFRSTADFGSSGSQTFSSSAFGVGAGVMVSYGLTGNLSLVGDLGIDQFFGSSITVTSSNGNSDTFTPGDAGYNNVSNAFVRPGTVFKARIGIKTGF
ncbi:hypothetical protein E5F05_11650 [Deinococcus metallilatus]|uniref:Outer membrane protein beta-barrel domain-containing protein n=1 Tax=Deinococcus metallilatus TaxID=1211322 RepID=A0AAJ5F1B2_9DEIO|nr:hypothetical protein [Deinococcus metallilatus]MBB5295311.1 hypothetical protein [Deinococcus metallilatus]QBY08535.1 hypothetical protein E5F05_11650 [Deinococcus metallilatus]RXJ11045.1 hypothetical protein ERJ73_10470 [Deinococcus metallilatus]TLK21577.1 hypothetical protein FCS05_18840 [Deinococcus metallilatus]